MTFYQEAWFVAKPIIGYVLGLYITFFPALLAIALVMLALSKDDRSVSIIKTWVKNMCIVFVIFVVLQNALIYKVH